MDDNEYTKIKYVALGDSISEGYSEYFQFGLPGEMNGNEISGTSWPSYFARYVQQTFPNVLASYYNFALSSSRPDEWNYFFDTKNEKYNYETLKQKLEYISFLNKNELNPFKDRIEKYFNNFDNNPKNKYQFLISKIKEANLITINIGANSALPNIPISEILKSIFNTNSQNVYELKERIDTMIDGIKTSINSMFVNLKKINSNAKIYVIGYVLPFNLTFRLINKKFSLFSELIGKPICTYFIEKLNEIIKEYSLKNSLNYIDVFDNKYWQQNSSDLSEVFYDIHPSIKGYKKIAQDIFLKVFYPTKMFENWNLVKNEFSYLNSNYYKKDYQAFESFFDSCDLNHLDIQKKVKQTLEYESKRIFVTDSFERETNVLIKGFFIEKSLKNIDFNKSSIIEIGKNIKAILEYCNIEFNDKKISRIKELFEDNSFVNFCLEYKILSSVFWDVQKELNKRNQQVTLNEFQKIFISTMFEPERLFLSIKQMFEYFKDEGVIEEIIYIFSNIFLMLLKNNEFKRKAINFFELIVSSVFKKINIRVTLATQQKIIKNIYKSLNIENILNNLFEFITKNKNEILKAKNSKEFLEIYLSKNVNSDKILNIINKFIIENNKTRTQIVNHLINKYEINNLSQEEKEKINFFIVDFAKTFFSNQFVKELAIEFSINFLLISNEEITIQSIIDFMLSLNKKNYWNKLKNFNLSKFSNYEKLFELFIDVSDILFKKISVRSHLFYELKNITTTKVILNKNDTVNVMQLLLILDKLLCLTNLLHLWFDYLYKKYVETRTCQRDVNNKYYKSMFRSLTILLFVNYKLFQSKLKTNIFWTKSILFKYSPSIVNYVFRFLINRNEAKTEKKQFFLAMLGELNNPDLINKYSERNYKKFQLLWYINSHEKNPTDLFTKRQKTSIIFESIKQGFWILDKEKK